jgi:hypothetical protein
MRRYERFVTGMIVGVCFAIASLPSVLRGEDPYQTAWGRQVSATSLDVAYGVSADGLGNIYISGTTQTKLTVQYAPEDGFTTKFDAAGNLLWTRKLGGTASDIQTGISADKLGNVFVSGSTETALSGVHQGYKDAYVSKYNSAGTLQWTRLLGTPGGTNIAEEFYDAAADGLGNVFLAGFTIGSLAAPNQGDADVLVAKYNSAGTLVNVAQFGTAGSEHATGIALDPSGNYFVTGSTTGDLAGPILSSGFDAFLRKYSPDGSVLWTRQLGSTGEDRALGIDIDDFGNAFIVGSTNGSLAGPIAGAQDAFVSKYDPAGNLLWTRQFGGNEDDRAQGVTADASGNVILTGWTETADQFDIFATKYDSAGNLIWMKTIGSDMLDVGWGISSDSTGVYIAGSTLGSPFNTNGGNYDPVLVKLIPEPASLSLALWLPALYVFICNSRKRRGK